MEKLMNVLLFALIGVFMIIAAPFYVIYAFGKALCDIEGFGDFCTYMANLTKSPLNDRLDKQAFKRLDEENQRLKSQIKEIKKEYADT